MRFQFSLHLLVATAGLQVAFAAPNADKAKFQQDLADLVKNSGLTAGVAIKDLVSGDEFLLKADDVFPQGNCIRIHLIAELYRQAAAKKLSLDTVITLPESARTGGFGVLRYMGRGTVSMSLRDYAVLASTVNDNTAANILTDVVGMENVNASLAAQGTPEIKFQRRAVSRLNSPTRMPENVATPRAVMRALELLHQGRVVDRATSDAILELIALPEVSFFPRDLPLGVRIAGQSGSGPTFRGDEGIVLLPRRPYVFCVMVVGRFGEPGTVRDYAKADALIGSLSRLALAHFGRAARRSARPGSSD